MGTAPARVCGDLRGALRTRFPGYVASTECGQACAFDLRHRPSSSTRAIPRDVRALCRAGQSPGRRAHDHGEGEAGPPHFGCTRVHAYGALAKPDLREVDGVDPGDDVGGVIRPPRLFDEVAARLLIEVGVPSRGEVSELVDVSPPQLPLGPPPGAEVVRNVPRLLHSS